MGGVATLRTKKPGVWELRVFTGTDARGSPTQVSRTVSGGLGHSNPAMTWRVYAHAFAAVDQALAAGLGDLLREDDG